MAVQQAPELSGLSAFVSLGKAGVVVLALAQVLALAFVFRAFSGDAPETSLAPALAPALVEQLLLR